MSLGLAIVQEFAAGELWDDAIWHQLATDVVRHARDAGALAVLPSALVYRAGVHVFAGEFATAATLIEEADLDRRSDGPPRAAEIPLTVAGCLAGDSGRRGPRSSRLPPRMEPPGVKAACSA